MTTTTNAIFGIFNEDGTLLAAATEAQILADNDGDPDVADAIEAAKRGETGLVGGGAAPLFETRLLTAETAGAEIDRIHAAASDKARYCMTRTDNAEPYLSTNEEVETYRALRAAMATDAPDPVCAARSCRLGDCAGCNHAAALA